MGQRVTPQQIVADWVEYQQMFNDLLERWSAKLARDAKAEKERIKRLDAATPVALVPQQPSNTQTKTELRSKVAKMRGFGLMDSKLPMSSPEVKDEPVS